MGPILNEELLEVLDNMGNSVGQVCPRSLVHKHGYFHATVHVWVVNNSHDLLLQKRSHVKDINPGMWDISCAGHLIAGDTSQDAAVRELHEELGIEVGISELFFLCSTVQSYSSTDGLIQDNEFTDVYLLALHNDQLIRRNPQEIDEIKFISVETFNSMVTRADPQLVPHMDEYQRVLKIISNVNMW